MGGGGSGVGGGWGWGWGWGGGGYGNSINTTTPSQPKLYLQKINIAQTCTYKNVWNAMQSMAGDVSRNKSNGNSFNKKAIINHSKMIALVCTCINCHTPPPPPFPTSS